ncbi:hypothetical protein GEMRC1_013442 [Eukaryota sp. GEM-RC1]
MRFVFGKLFSKSDIVAILSLFLCCVGLVFAVLSFLLQSKALSFIGFVIGLPFYYVYFFHRPLIKLHLVLVLEESKVLGLSTYASVYAFAIPFFHNFIWFIVYLNGLMFYSFLFSFELNLNEVLEIPL